MLQRQRFVSRTDTARPATGRQGRAQQPMHRASRLVSPVMLPGGTSCRGWRESAHLDFLRDPSGCLNANASAATCASDFQSVIRSVYCGAPAMASAGDDVYCAGSDATDLDPELPIGVRDCGRRVCSHSTPSMTPRPMLLASNHVLRSERHTRPTAADRRPAPRRQTHFSSDRPVDRPNRAHPPARRICGTCRIP